MKKYLLGLLLFSISLLGYSEVSSIKEGTLTQTTEEVVKQITSKEPNATVVYMTEKLQQFVESLKVPAEKVWQTLVKQQVINGYMLLASCFISLILLIIFVVMFARAGGFNEDGFWNIGGFIGVILFGILFTVSIISFCNVGIGQIFNPEYGAIKEIMELF